MQKKSANSHRSSKQLLLRFSWLLRGASPHRLIVAFSGQPLFSQAGAVHKLVDSPAWTDHGRCSYKNIFKN
jgi:hypothetical protein